MEVVGWIATVLAGIVVIAAVVMGLRSVPDAQRYLRMRRM